MSSKEFQRMLEQLEAEEKAFEATVQENEEIRKEIIEGNHRITLLTRELAFLKDKQGLIREILRDRPVAEQRAARHMTMDQILEKAQRENHSLRRKIDKAAYDRDLSESGKKHQEKTKKSRRKLRDKQRVVELEEEVEKGDLEIKELGTLLDKEKELLQQGKDERYTLVSRMKVLEKEVTEKTEKAQREKHSLRRKIDKAAYDRDLSESEKKHQEKTQKSRRKLNPIDLQEERDKQRVVELEEEVEKGDLEIKELRTLLDKEKELLQQGKDERYTLVSRMKVLEKEVTEKTEKVNKLKAINPYPQLLRERAQLEEMKKCYNEKKKRNMEELVKRKKNVSKLNEDVISLKRKARILTKQCKAQKKEALEKEAQPSSQEVRTEDEVTTLRKTCQHLMRVTGVTDVRQLEFFTLEEEELQGLKEEEETQKMPQPPQDRIQQQQDIGLIQGAHEVFREEQRKQVEVCKRELQDEQLKLYAAEKLFHQQGKALSINRLWLEDVAKKLQHIELPEDTVVEVSPDSEEYLLVLKTKCEMKLQILQQKFEGKDLDAISEEIKSDFLDYIQNNISVKLSEDRSAEDSPDESDKNVRNDPGVLSRMELKMQSQEIVDANSKKKKKRGRK